MDVGTVCYYHRGWIVRPAADANKLSFNFVFKKQNVNLYM
jgi:hypothetical protein